MIYPYDTKEFKEMWDLWKQYRKEQHKFTYKSHISEQAALKKVGKLYANEEMAILGIEQSMENGWRGLFPLQQKKNIHEDILNSLKYM